MARSLMVFGLVLSLFLAAAPSVHGHDAFPSFALTVSAGASIPAGNWNFQTLTNVNMVPKSSYGVGIEYDPMWRVSGAKIVLSGEVSHVHEGTGLQSEGESLWRAAELSMGTTGIVACATLAGPGALAPFFRVGLGAGRVAFSESYPHLEVADRRFDYWGFAYAGATGVRYALTGHVGLSLFVDVLYVPGERLVMREDGIETGIFRGKFCASTRLGVGYAL